MSARDLDSGGIALQPVRLVLLLLDGSREGENDFLEFPSIEDAVAYSRELNGQRRFQLEGIEDLNGRMLVCYDDLRSRWVIPIPGRNDDLADTRQPGSIPAL